jgi:hypothetical protein
MENINQNISHIYCPTCDRYWQVLNDSETEWDEEKTAKKYYDDMDSCNSCPK